jgi:hypothetical protein
MLPAPHRHCRKNKLYMFYPLGAAHTKRHPIPPPPRSSLRHQIIAAFDRGRLETCWREPHAAAAAAAANSRAKLPLRVALIGRTPTCRSKGILVARSGGAFPHGVAALAKLPVAHISARACRVLPPPPPCAEVGRAFYRVT